MAVDLADDHCSFNGEVLAQIIANDLLAGLIVDDTAVCVANLAKVLTALVSIINGNRESNLFDVCRNCRQINKNLLIVTLAIAGAIVTHMLYGAARVFQIAIKYEILIARALAVCASEKSRGIKIEILSAVVLVGIPSEANHDLFQTRSFLR